MTNNTTLLPLKNALLKVNLNRGQIKLIAWPNYNFFFEQYTIWIWIPFSGSCYVTQCLE